MRAKKGPTTMATTHPDENPTLPPEVPPAATLAESTQKPPRAASAPKSAAPSVPSVPKQAVQNFEVLEDAEVPRGASTFRLIKGKVVSRASYDIRHLEAVGVKLKPRPDLG